MQATIIPFAKESDLPGSLAPLLRLALTETAAQGVYIYLFDPLVPDARLAAWAGLTPSSSSEPDAPGAAIRTHFGRSVPIVLSDRAFSDSRFEGLAEFQTNRFEAVISVPLFERGQVIGIANVCRLRSGALEPRALSFLLELAVPIGALLAGAADRLALRREVETLSRRLEDRKLIDRAKGLLQDRLQWSEEQSYLYLRRTSRQKRTPMRAIATEIINAGGVSLPETLRRAG